MDSKPQSSSEMNGTGAAAAGDGDNGDSGDWKLGVSPKNQHQVT